MAQPDAALDTTAGRDVVAGTALDAARCLRGLDPKYREALVLTKFEGRTLPEAARLAGVSETAMKTRVYRAIRLARRTVKGEPL